MSSTMTMTIKLINPPGSTGRGSIVGTDDQRLGIFPEKAAMFETGKTYEIEYVENERNGRMLRNVKSAKLITAASPATQTAAPQTNGICTAFTIKDEQIFVVALLKSLIEAGEIKNDKTQLWATTQMLRGLWKHSFGFVEPAQGLQAAE